MVDVRRITVILVIAVLFALFVNVLLDAAYPAPEYDEFCDERVARPLVKQDCEHVAVSAELEASCEGKVSFQEDEFGCPTEAYCEMCGEEWDEARTFYNLIVFIVSAIAGLLALIAGLYLPKEKNPINEWVGSGFLLGGVFTIFVGTVRYFGDMGRWTRVIIIFVELLLVIWLTYKKLGKK